MIDEHNRVVKRTGYLLWCFASLTLVAFLSSRPDIPRIGEMPANRDEWVAPEYASSPTALPGTDASVTSARIAPDHVPGLTHEPEWIDARIARKESCSAEGDRPENPDQRARERYRDRAGEDGTFSFQEVLQAKAQAERMPQLDIGGEDGARDAGIWQWEWLGPGNVGGRIRSIIIHPSQPNKMWIGAVSGGIWRTTDGGTSWTPVNDFLPSLSVSTMAMSPDDPNVIFAGTGEGFGGSGMSTGAGVFKSTNGGVTWVQLSGTSTWPNVNRIAIDPDDGQHILAATEDGIYANSNGGEGTWYKRWPVATYLTHRVLDVKFDYDFLHSQTRAVAGLRDGRALYSSNGGDTWDEATFSGTIFCTHFTEDFNADGDDDADVIKVAATTGFAKKDTLELTGATTELTTVTKVVDGTTLEVGDLGDDFATDAFICVEQSGRVELGVRRGSVVYASVNAGGGTLYRSDDLGETYNIVASSANTPRYFHSDEDPNKNGQGNYDNVIWVSPDDSDFIVVGGIDLWRSSDGGVTLEKISHWREYHVTGSPHADHHAIVPHPNYDGTSNKTIYVGNDGGIQKTDDIKSPALGTLGWTNLAHNLGITQFYAGAASPNGDLFGGAQDNGILKLTAGDGPQNWFQCVICTGDGGFCAVNPTANNVVYATTQNLEIKRSVTWGNSYVPFTLGLSDAGDGNNARFIAPIALDPNDAATVIAGGSSIWKSTGDLWTAIRGKLPLVGDERPLCSAIAFTHGSSDIIYVGYDTGRISHTTSDHQSWVDVDDNGPLPAAVVTDIAVNPRNWQELFVTFGGYGTNNVWYSDDSGFTWQQRTGSGEHALPRVHVNTISFHHYNSDWIYVGTDLGLFASEDRGLTWNRTPRFSNVDHEGPVNTEVHDLFWQGSDLIVATHGRGMWKTRPMNTVYVDRANTGAEDGTIFFPYNTISEGVDAAGNGTTINITDGDYNESGTILVGKRVDIVVEGSVTIR